MNENTNILLVGVGGQGTILASKVIGSVAIKSGFDVKISEIHGMAQRGGSVVTHVRFGKKIFAPTIEPGTAHILLAFEKLEALRWQHYLRRGGTMIVNTREIYPLPVLTGEADYPENIIELLQSKTKSVIPVDAFTVAVNSGNEKTLNVVLLGILAATLNLDRKFWEESVSETVPPKTIGVNLAAFDVGFELATNPRACK